MVDLSKASPSRLVGLAHIPLLDLDEAQRELTRVAKAGLRGFPIDPFPDERGGRPLWDSAYEPFWSLVAETGLPMSFHIVGPRKQNVTETFMNPTPGIKETFIAIAPISICETVSTLIFTGILARHPSLRFVLVECGIGWIPYFLERMDQTFNKHRFWTKSIITEKPSTYWYRQGYATFIQDLAGVAERHRAGLKNIMWSTDYPHSDSTWPKSREALEAHFKDVPAAERTMIAAGHCAALEGLPGSCGAVGRLGARFCGTCGAWFGERSAVRTPYTPKHVADVLGGRAAVEAERRRVTVLFADMVGFTPFAEQLDPEDVH